MLGVQAQGGCSLRKVGRRLLRECHLSSVPSVGWPASLDDRSIVWGCGRPGRCLGFSLFRETGTDSSPLFPISRRRPLPALTPISAIEGWGAERSPFSGRRDVHEERHQLVFCPKIEGRGSPKQLLIRFGVMLRKGGWRPAHTACQAVPVRGRGAEAESTGDRITQSGGRTILELVTGRGGSGPAPTSGPELRQEGR